MAEVSSDVFFKVKKDILDKLDLILQRTNLSIVRSLKPHQTFNLIQLSAFEDQIAFLFNYLDRLYASLNSSVSFQSIVSFKSNCETYALENVRLKSENIQLRTLLNKSSFNQDFQYVRQQIRQLNQDYVFFTKQIQKQLKTYKFQLLQRRVQTITKIKQVDSRKCTVAGCGNTSDIQFALHQIMQLCNNK